MIYFQHRFAGGTGGNWQVGKQITLQGVQVWIREADDSTSLSYLKNLEYVEGTMRLDVSYFAFDL